jgi:hypothetical protein
VCFFLFKLAAGNKTKHTLLMKRSALTGLFFGILLGYNAVFAQQSQPQGPTISFKRGIAIVAPDSIFSVAIRFRVQNRAIYSTISGNDLSASDIEARVRRLRLRFDGFIYNPKLTYQLQLSFSRGDMDFSARENSAINVSPNVVRDAAISYKPDNHFTFVFGQTKLPGNRQRVISSGEQQFLERSIVNAAFTVDRDFGLHAYYQNRLGSFVYVFKTAISTGEGRNVQATNGGLAYTGRIELLPLGEFTNRGDYFEGDLEREKTPKLSLAGGLSYNEDAKRTGGQLGRDLYAGRDITTYIFDGVFKYNGLAVYGEYLIRDTKGSPITENADGKRYVLTGRGGVVQTSYMFPNFYEIAGRYARVTPVGEVRALENQEDTFTLGVTKYLRRHQLKVQSNLSYHTFNRLPTQRRTERWSLGFQIELGL